ncbi:MAG: DUF5640 domain-containing protein [Defluviitaleaceae bacterium]|nr:DUF5640 domain-containing protein [Defluviitaleaceae bacterium]
MKKLIVLFAATALLAGLVLMTGCTQRDSDLVGSWTFEQDSQWVTTFNEGGSGSHALDWGYGTTFTWSTSRNNIYWNYPGHPRMYTAYSISGNVLTMTMEDGTVYRYIRN